jgi:hypothetical protein
MKSGRNCPACGVVAKVLTTRRPAHREILVFRDPACRCPSCGREWIALGERFVLGDPPLDEDEPGYQEWFDRYHEALTGDGGGGRVTLSVEEYGEGEYEQHDPETYPG